MSCEYLIASLPALSFGDKPPISEAALLDAAEGKVPSSVIATMRALLSGAEDHDPYAVAWRQAETQLRNAVAGARAARLGMQADEAARWKRPHTGPWRVSIEEGVAAAFAQPGPMERHQALQRLRWDLAGELAGLSPFSPEALFAYAVRLGILAELSKSDPEAGLARLRALAETKTGQQTSGQTT